jgi:nucleoside-diphosphate kinase
METTLIMLKPDCVQRGLCGQVLGRFERKGLKIVGMKMVQVTEAIARKHYAEHVEKPFFPSLLSFITSSPVVVLAVAGPNAVSICRKLIGATNGAEAEPGTIRGDFGHSKSMNLVHGSDSAESARRELAIWFTDDEQHDWNRTADQWMDG